MTADWQRGVELDELKALTQPFRVRHKPLVFGAFGLTKERDVADAITGKRFTFARAGASVGAAAIWKRLRSSSSRVDFRGVAVEIPAGDLVVSAFAATDADAGARVLRKLVDGAKSPVWACLFEEDKIATKLARDAGLEKAATQITAGSEVIGLYVIGRPLPPQPESAENASLCMLTERFAGVRELEAARAELEKLESPWAQHYSSYNKRKSWTAFALRGYDPADPGFIVKPAEMSKSWKEQNQARLGATADWTLLAAKLPAAMALVKKIPGVQLDRVRLMRLAPEEGELTRHADITDRDAGVADGKIARLHVPLITAEGVVFRSWTTSGDEHQRFFPPGCLFYLDQRKPHAVRNGSPIDRVHLVVDVVSGPELRRLIAKGK